VKIRDIIKLLEQDGWVLVTQKGSHRQFKHPIKPGRVTVPENQATIWHPARSTASSDKRH